MTDDGASSEGMVRSVVTVVGLVVLMAVAVVGCTSGDEPVSTAAADAPVATVQPARSEPVEQEAAAYGPTEEASRDTGTDGEDSDEDRPVGTTTTTAPLDPPPPPASPTLPTPGEQPADADSARAEVTAVYLRYYDGSRTSEQRAADVDDPTNLAETTDAIEAQFPGAMAQARGTVHEVVFESPDRAAVLYEVNLAGFAAVPESIGSAHLIDGIWKVGRETACRDAARGGIDCDTAMPFEIALPIPPPNHPPATTAPPAVAVLPPAGPQQPADQAGAQQAVIDAVEGWFDWSSQPAERVENVDDPTGLVEILELLESRFGRSATDSVGLVDAVVFTSPTQAAALYRIELDGNTVIGPVVGNAVLVDGLWKVTRQTACDNFAVGGVAC